MAFPLPYPAVEDLYEDITAKAARGLGVQLPAVLPRDQHAVCQLAARLQLNPSALWESACEAYKPAQIGEFAGLAMFVTSYGDMLVNSYVIYDPASGHAAVFDTGSDCDPLIGTGCNIQKIFLTHAHGDHIFDLDRLCEKTGATAFSSAREPVDGTASFADGTFFSIGSLRVETRRTSGHAIGGVTFVIYGLERPLAIVGDALFAGSMGGTKSPVAYVEALQTNQKAIFTLADEAIICPGHGPLTTVAEEKLHNPFFVG